MFQNDLYGFVRCIRRKRDSESLIYLRFHIPILLNRLVLRMFLCDIDRNFDPVLFLRFRVCDQSIFQQHIFIDDRIIIAPFLESADAKLVVIAHAAGNRRFL